MRHQSQPSRHDFNLTLREWQVICLAATGAFEKDIAAALGITVRTVSVHTRNIRAKTNADSTKEAVAKVFRLCPVDDKTEWDYRVSLSLPPGTTPPLCPKNSGQEPLPQTVSREVRELSESAAHSSAKAAADAVSEFNVGNYEAARDLYRDAYKDDPSLNNLEQLGFALYYTKEYEEATRTLEAALARRGNDSLLTRETAECASNLASCYLRLGRLKDAEWHYWKALAVYNTTSGDTTFETFAELVNLGVLFQSQNNLTFARTIYRQAEERFRAIEDDRGDARDLATLYNNLGLCLFKLGDTDAIEILRRAHEMRTQLLGENHPLTSQTGDHLSRAVQMVRTGRQT